jgi:hypothetical protein
MSIHTVKFLKHFVAPDPAAGDIDQGTLIESIRGDDGLIRTLDGALSTSVFKKFFGNSFQKIVDIDPD